jgi:hypothetical protein
LAQTCPPAALCNDGRLDTLLWNRAEVKKLIER